MLLLAVIESHGEEAHPECGIALSSSLFAIMRRDEKLKST
jgi:hypothetical protein